MNYSVFYAKTYSGVPSDEIENLDLDEAIEYPETKPITNPKGHRYL